MTILVLTKLWLNRLDTGQAISGASGRDRSTTYAMDGDVRTYASGRRRGVATAGVKTEVSRRMVSLDYATKEALISWLGVSVQMRDHRGNKWYGVFYAVEVTEYMRPDLYAATITLQVTTTVEGV
jgi:hypothetical protein